jgi:RNA polymerase sigma factor (sigma-70 family)
MSDDLSVADLLTRARNGDRQAWDVLVQRFVPLIWSICRRHQLDDADANDVVQNVWMQLVQALEMIRDPAALPGWLATATRRECFRILSAARRPQLAGYLLDAMILPDQRSDAAEQELLVAERHAALREAFTCLPPCCQGLIALLIEDPPVPYAEISTRLNIPVGSIGPNRGAPPRQAAPPSRHRHPDQCPSRDRVTCLPLCRHRPPAKPGMGLAAWSP